MNRSSARTTLLLLAALGFCCVYAHAQKSKSGPSSSGSASSASQGSDDGSSGNSNFSIETEMFTYKAVEENSQVIACDIARYLFQGELNEAPAGSRAPCAISGGSSPAPGIIIVSSDSSLFTGFQLWRADMATMSSLEARANNVCVPAAPKSGQEAPSATEPQHIRSRGLGSTVAGLAKSTTPGEAASALGDVMQLFSSSQSVSSVVGTVQNPALLNEVARQLRSLNVQVLVPELYNPYALGAADYTTSPYLKNLAGFFSAYDKCEKAKSSYPDNAAEAADLTSVIGSMDSFLKAVLAVAQPAQPGSGGTQDKAAEPTSPAVNAPSHFAAALAADDLAKQIGFTGDGTAGPSATWQHVLWLKALESGGSVNKQSNLFGTKVSYGGGAVDTYSVFRLNGELVCSGNVYSFQPPVQLKDLEKSFQAAPKENPAKLATLHSTCALLPPS